eukprot:6463616-Amphidinium_carterae.1
MNDFSWGSSHEDGTTLRIPCDKDTLGPILAVMYKSVFEHGAKVQPRRQPHPEMPQGQTSPKPFAPHCLCLN